MEQTEVDLIIMEARVKGIEYKRLAATPKLTTAPLLKYKQRWSSVVNLMRNLFRMSYTLMQCNLFYTIITIYKKYQVLWEKKIAPSTLPSTQTFNSTFNSKNYGKNRYSNTQRSEIYE